MAFRGLGVWGLGLAVCSERALEGSLGLFELEGLWVSGFPKVLSAFHFCGLGVSGVFC